MGRCPRFDVCYDGTSHSPPYSYFRSRSILGEADGQALLGKFNNCCFRIHVDEASNLRWRQQAPSSRKIKFEIISHGARQNALTLFASGLNPFWLLDQRLEALGCWFVRLHPILSWPIHRKVVFWRKDRVPDTRLVQSYKFAIRVASFATAPFESC